MSSESRVLRPFEVADRLAGALRRARFSYGNLHCGADEGFVVEDGSFGMRQPVIEWAAEDEFDDFKKDLVQGAVDTGLDKSLLCLAVTVRSGYLKTCDLVWVCSLDDLSGLERRVDIGERAPGSRWDAFRAETHGAEVDIYVARRRGAGAPSRRRPSRKGAWLAHVSFRIRCESDSELFKPQPLDDTSRRDLGLPAKTMRFVDIDNGESVTDPLHESSVPILWVDEQLLSDLDAHAATPLAQHLQRQLAIDFIASVVFEFSRLSPEEMSSSYDEIRDSLIGRIVRFLVRGGDDAACEAMLRTCRDKPREAVAQAEHAVDILAAAKKSLEE